MLSKGEILTKNTNNKKKLNKKERKNKKITTIKLKTKKLYKKKIGNSCVIEMLDHIPVYILVDVQ